MKKLFLVVFSFSMLSILSCGPNYIFDESKEIEGGEWAYVDTLNFEVDIKDTLEIYNLYLDIEHSTDFSKQNIYIQIYTRFPSGQRIKERVAIDFADKLLKDMTVVENNLYQTKSKSNQDPLNFPIKLNNKLGHLNSLTRIGDFKPTDQAIAFKNEITKDIDIELNKLYQIFNSEVKQLNQKVKDSQIDFIQLD